MDRYGNVLGLQAHLPFGEDFGESGTQEKHHFTLYERDGESANDYAKNRLYSFSLGRFLSADPCVAGASAADPRSWNRYSYAMNVPINRVDPEGLIAGRPPGEGGGGVEGGCPPPGSGGGPFPGRCLCTTVPELCGGGHPGYPPQEDASRDGGGGDEPSIQFTKVRYRGNTTDFLAVDQAFVDLNSDDCQLGHQFGIEVFFRLTSAQGVDKDRSQVVLVGTKNEDHQFELAGSPNWDQTYSDGGNVAIGLNRVARSGASGVKITVYYKSKQNNEFHGDASVKLKCK